eukprot:14473392-Alexandrium_andersonii.AAC.1
MGCRVQCSMCPPGTTCPPERLGGEPCGLTILPGSRHMVARARPDTPHHRQCPVVLVFTKANTSQRHPRPRLGWPHCGRGLCSTTGGRHSKPIGEFDFEHVCGPQCPPCQLPMPDQ